VFNAVLYSGLAIFILRNKVDHTMVPFYVGIAVFSLAAWMTSYTKLDKGLLTRRLFLVPYRSILVDTIERIQPHEKNGKWGHGTVIQVYSTSGSRLTLQPNHPKQFLALLRRQAPHATYHL
jgi:hypothetical protein